MFRTVETKQKFLQLANFKITVLENDIQRHTEKVLKITNENHSKSIKMEV